MITTELTSEDLFLFNCWQFGDWESLAHINVETGTEKHFALKASAQLQLGESQRAKKTLEATTRPLTEETKRILISGLFNTLGKAFAIIGDLNRAEANFTYAITTSMSSIASNHAIQARKKEQLAQVNYFTRWISLANLDVNGKSKKLFIDCGGHDGCSSVKAKLKDPSYDVITFEGNPVLWPYYDLLPTRLIKKLVSDRNGEVEFIIDPIDADGSSIVKEKSIDFHKKIKNDDCPVIITPCIDLSEFIVQQSQYYEEIVLKLDVEGAEYAILNKMLKDGSVKYIRKLYAEFHWKKINMPKAEHDALVEELKAHFDIEDWDAAEFQVHTKLKSNQKIRHQILHAIS